MRKARLPVKATAQFKRDYKLSIKRGFDIEALEDVVFRLSWGALAPKDRDHALSGAWQGCRECHIANDWLLVYRIEEGTIVLSRTGTHSDLFGK